MGEEVLYLDVYYDFMRALEDVGLTGEQLETAVTLLNNLQTLSYDLLTYLTFVLPLLIGIVIGLIAVKTFWDGASRW